MYHMRIKCDIHIKISICMNKGYWILQAICNIHLTYVWHMRIENCDSYIESVAKLLLGHRIITPRPSCEPYHAKAYSEDRSLT